MSKELLEEVKSLRQEMFNASKEHLIYNGRPIIKIDPVRVRVVLDGMIEREEKRLKPVVEEYKDSGFTDDFGIHME